MHFFKLRSGLISGLMLIVCLPVSGQDFHIQQPVISNYSLQTSVSIPDGGSAYLSNVSRAYEYYEFASGLPRYTYRGQQYQSSRMSASVRIHDFSEMDEALLRDETRWPGTGKSKNIPEYRFSRIATRSADDNPILRRKTHKGVLSVSDRVVR